MFWKFIGDFEPRKLLCIVRMLPRFEGIGTVERAYMKLDKVPSGEAPFPREGSAAIATEAAVHAR